MRWNRTWIGMNRIYLSQTMTFCCVWGVFTHQMPVHHVESMMINHGLCNAKKVGGSEKKVEIFPFVYSPNGKMSRFLIETTPKPNHFLTLATYWSRRTHWFILWCRTASKHLQTAPRIQHHQLIWLGSCGSDVGIFRYEPPTKKIVTFSLYQSHFLG